MDPKWGRKALCSPVRRTLKQCGPWTLLNWGGRCDMGTPKLRPSGRPPRWLSARGGNRLKLQENLKGWTWTQGNGGAAGRRACCPGKLRHSTRPSLQIANQIKETL